MAEIVNDASVFLGGVDLSGASNQVSLGHGTDVKDRTNFASGGWRQHVAGLQSAEGLEIVGFRPRAEQPTEHVWTTANYPFGVIIGSNPPAENNVARFCFSRRQTWMPVGDLRVGELNALKISLSGTGRLYNGRVLAYSASASTGNGGSVSLGAVAAGEVLGAALFVHVVTGSPTLDVTVQRDDASGFPSPATALTFAQATEIGGQLVESSTAEASDTFYRGNWTVGGTGTIGFLLLAGIE